MAKLANVAASASEELRVIDSNIDRSAETAAFHSLGEASGVVLIRVAGEAVYSDQRKIRLDKSERGLTIVASFNTPEILFSYIEGKVGAGLLLDS